MQHFYNTNYSNTHDTMRPQLEMRGDKIYATRYNATEGSHALPWFEVRGDKIYSTTHNPQGHGLHPWFEIKNNQVFQTEHHPEGRSHMPTFHIR